MLALEIYEDDLCNGCGLPASVRNDPQHNVFRIVHDTCPVCSKLAQHGRAEAAADQKARESRNDTPAAPLPSDGRTTSLQRVTGAEAEAAVRATRDGQ